MHSSKKGQQMYFGMKAHIGADAESGLVHTVRGTSANVHDVVEGNSLLHGEESVAFGDAGYQGIEKRPDANADVTWHVAMRPGKRRALNKENAADALIDKAEKLKAGIRAKVEHPFRGDQAPIRIYESALSRLEEKHRPTRHIVCAIEFVDGAQQTDGSAGMSASESRGNGLHGPENSPMGRKNSATLKGCA
jgi:transposase, IS5 family